MKTTGKFLVVGTLLCIALTAGCKKVNLMVYNHSDSAREIRVTTPEEGTLPVGSVSAGGGRLSYTIKIKNEDMPARCGVSAGVGNTQVFTVNEDTKDKLWFHVTRNGELTGPFTKDDTFVDSEDGMEIEMKVQEELIVH